MYEMKKVFICSPYRGDVEKNVEKARYYSRMAAVCGYCPITPHLFFPQFLKDDDPQERIKAIKLGGELMKMCDEVWVHGSRVSSGMAYELEAAKSWDCRSSSMTNKLTVFSRYPDDRRPSDG